MVEYLLNVCLYFLELVFALRQEGLGAFELRGELVYFEFTALYGVDDAVEFGQRCFIGEGGFGHKAYFEEG